LLYYLALISVNTMNAILACYNTTDFTITVEFYCKAPVGVAAIATGLQCTNSQFVFLCPLLTQIIFNICIAVVSCIYIN